MKRFTLYAGLLLATPSFGQAPNEYPRFQEADTNGDGIIQVNEVQRMIDGFFIGSHDRGVMYVHSLIDFFFEQP